MPWQPGAEVWHYRVNGDRYEPLLLGHVRFVGEKGYTVQLVEPDVNGDREMKIEFDCPRIWRSEAETREWCDEHHGPWSHMRRGD
jgi:hypothetical protein